MLRRRRSGFFATENEVPASMQTVQSGAAVPAILPERWDMPAELAGFRRVEAFELSDADHDALLARLTHIPRPPNGLHKLLSPQFLEEAMASELSELILAEPAVAAKVLATVNSPFYGLPRPVTSVDQAIAVLGMDAVRGICLRHMVSESLRPADPGLQPVFDKWWNASALASQLALRLGQRLGVPDPGAMVTQAVLSFLGHMVAMSLQPAEATLANARSGFLERTRREQETLGLCAGELGCLMMKQWEMPDAIIEDVRAVDRILTTPPKQLDSHRGLRLALSYYSARVAEKLATGEWADLSQAAPEALRGSEFFHLQTHFMVHPRLKLLAQDFRDPAFVAEMTGMLQSVRSL
ncbi:hypothetical protein GCM10027292_11690 [Hydrogenophaga aquatica]